MLELLNGQRGCSFPALGRMLDVRSYVFVSPHYASQLPAGTSNSIVQYCAPRPGDETINSPVRKGTTAHVFGCEVLKADSRVSAAAGDAASAAARFADEVAHASGHEASGAHATPPSQRNETAAPASAVIGGVPTHLHRPHAPLRCRPDDAAVLQLLLPSALVPVDLSLHSSLRDAAIGEASSTTGSLASASRVVGAKDVATATLGCFSHPQASASSSKPAAGVHSPAQACTGALLESACRALPCQQEQRYIAIALQTPIS